MAIFIRSPTLSPVNSRLSWICWSVRPMSCSLLYRIDCALWQFRQ
ncbi:Uncharacterised protein [Bordetella pertussis]|nr:Uncharacterised protein [Bordetella pertussis]